MSGVIDEHGQWEHCNVCLEFVLIQKLLYEQPTERFKHGRDICKACSEMDPKEQDELSDRRARQKAEESMQRYREMGWVVELCDDLSIIIHKTN